MYIRHLIILLLLAARTGAQTHRIDSIRKLIPGLSGREQVDNFNALAQEYYFYWIHSDSALKYSELAYQKASGISYISAKAEALLIRAGVEGICQPEIPGQHDTQGF